MQSISYKVVKSLLVVLSLSNSYAIFSMNLGVKDRLNNLMIRVGLKETKEKRIERLVNELKKYSQDDFKGPSLVEGLYNACGSKEKFRKVLHEQIISPDNFSRFGHKVCEKITAIDQHCLSFFKQYITLESLVDDILVDGLLLNTPLFQPAEIACVMKFINEKTFRKINSKILVRIVTKNQNNQKVMDQLASCIIEEDIINPTYGFLICQLMGNNKDFYNKVFSWVTEENFININPFILNGLVHISSSNMTTSSDFKKFLSFITKETIHTISPITLNFLILGDQSSEKEIIKKIVSYITENNLNSIHPMNLQQIVSSDKSIDGIYKNKLKSFIKKDNFFKFSYETLGSFVPAFSGFKDELISWVDEATLPELTPNLYITLQNKNIKILTLKLAGSLAEFPNQSLDMYLFAPKKAFVRSMAYKLLGKRENSEININPAYQHFRTTWEGIYDLFHRHLKDSKENCLSIFKMLKREALEVSKGRYTMCHGRNADQFVADVVFMYLQEMFFGKKIDKTCHATQHYAFPGEKSDLFESKTINLLDELVDQWVKSGITTSEEYSYERSCMQFAAELFNLKRGSSPLTYVFENKNVDKKRGAMTIEKLFKKLEKVLGKDLSAYYTNEENVKSFKEIEELAQKLQYGTMLMYSFTPQALKKYTYVTATTGGHKEPVKINGKGTNDSQTVMDALRNNPEAFDDKSKKYEYVMVLSDNGVANPFNEEITTYRFSMGNDEKIAKLIEQKICDVMTQIVGAMVQDGVIEPIERVSKL